MRKFLVTIAIISMSIKLMAQSNVQFSQYIFNGLYINPAYAGQKNDLFVNSFYRSQWTGIEGSPQTASLAADEAVNNSRVGLGIMFQYDQIGAQSNTSCYANYAYRIPLNDNGDSKIDFGLGFGFFQSGIDGSKLSATQINDNYVPTGYQGVLLPDARFGVLYVNKSFYASVSVDNLLANYFKGNSVLVPIPLPNEYLTIGALFNLSDDIQFKPSLLIRDNPYKSTTMDVNAFVVLKEQVWFGATYRSDIKLYNKKNLDYNLQSANAMMVTAEFSVNDSICVGYAYDYSLSKLSSYGEGTHELSLTFLLKKKHKPADISNQTTF